VKILSYVDMEERIPHLRTDERGTVISSKFLEHLVNKDTKWITE
jgi:hypothetical protein